MSTSNPKGLVRRRLHCKYCQASLMDYLEGKLGREEQSLVSEHLQNCPRCLAEKLALRETLGILARRELPEPDEHFWMELRHRVRQGVGEVRVYSPLFRPAPARDWIPAVVLASLFVFFFLWRVSQPHIPQPDRSPFLTRLEKEGQRSLQILEETWPETEDFQMAESPEDSLVALLVNVTSPRLVLERALISEKIALDPELWETVIDEQMISETPLEMLLEELNEDQLKKLSDKLQSLMG